GIRDGHVTGVQTCALPISASPKSPVPSPQPLVPTIKTQRELAEWVISLGGKVDVTVGGKLQSQIGAIAELPKDDFAVKSVNFDRSEERRVGKVCRSWWWRC